MIDSYIMIHLEFRHAMSTLDFSIFQCLTVEPYLIGFLQQPIPPETICEAVKFCERTYVRSLKANISKGSTVDTLFLCLIVLSDDNACKQFGPRSDLTKHQA